MLINYGGNNYINTDHIISVDGEETGKLIIYSRDDRRLTVTKGYAKEIIEQLDKLL